MKKDNLIFSDSVNEALKCNLPVVAMESAILTHGLPYPENSEYLWRAKKVAKDCGAEPATIAIINGRPHVGLTAKQEELLCSNANHKKLAMNDLGPGIFLNYSGGTTVSSSVYLSFLAGIRVFATGGIGGVHRGVKNSLDISQDLQAISRHPVAVVSSGAKAILDLEKTVEILEALSVPVVGFKTDEFPAFYSKTTGLKLSYRFDTVESLAGCIDVHFRFGGGSGLLIGNPPPDKFDIPLEEINMIVDKLVDRSKALGIRGKGVTPYLLEQIGRETGGGSLKTNVELAVNNVHLGALLAAAIIK